MISSLLLPFAFLLSLLLVAQAQQPLPSEGFAFARGGPKLYVQGGKFSQNDIAINTTAQLFALDLSTNWSVNAAPWQQLSPGISTTLFNGVMTPDNQTFITFINGVNGTIIIPRYHIASNSWDASPLALTPDQDYRQGIRPVIDPTTGLVYIAAWTKLDIFNPSTLTIELRDMPTTTFTSRLFSGATYIKSRGSIMYFGGLNGTIKFDPQATYVTEYTISTGQWSNFTTSGTPPSPRSDFCMTASEDGNTVVVYGGRIDLNTTHNPPTNFTGTFYTLDITTGKWSQGPDGGVRLYMACTIVGNQFVAWGGSGGSSTIVGPPVVFDLSLRKWVESYTAPAYYLSTSISATTSGLVPTGAVSSLPDGSKDSSSSSNLGAILGGVFGGLLVIALSGLIYLYLKRKEDRVRYGPPSNQQSAGSSEKADEPASTLQSQYSNGPASMNPQHVQFLRDPQDTSSFAQGPPGQVIFSSPIDSELEYCVSRKEAIPSPMFSSALGTAQPPTPIVYVPQTSYIPVTATGAPLGVFPPAPYTPTQDSSMMAPNSDIYRVHSIPPMTAATHNSNHFAGIISPVPTQAFNGYSAPLYAATDPTPFSNGTGYSSNYYSAPVASAIPPTIINASQQVYHPDNIRYPIPTNSAHDASAGGSDSIDTTIQPTSGMTVSSNGSNL